MKQKTALTVQSLACHGKCSLTEALPVISAKGISLSVLPTVLLSTHTGGFGTPKKLSTEKFLANSLEHFKKEGIGFDGIYTGYFASPSQISLFAKEIGNLKNENSQVLVDPVLGDDGRFFSGITEEFVAEMLSLCQKADIITPNVTEACLLAGEKENCDIMDLSLKLYAKTHAKVVITGIERQNKIGASFFDGDKIRFIFTKKQGGHFHGTGDIFASIVFAEILKGKAPPKAVKSAVKFISEAIKKTVNNERDGLAFEKLL